MNSVQWQVSGMLHRGGSPTESRGRLLMNFSTAVATCLLLAAANLVSMTESWSSEYAGLIAESGLRPGTAFTLVLLTIPVLAFAYQAARVNQASRDRRLAALRLAGATPKDVRWLGAFEAVRASAIGAILGGIAYFVLRATAFEVFSVSDTSRYGFSPLLVPPAIALVAAGAAFLGYRSSRHVLTSPLGVTRRVPPPPPGWKAMLLVPLGIVLFGLTLASIVSLFLAAALIMAGMSLSTSRLIAYTGRVAARRARRPETLIAARGLADDPRSWGRPLAVVGLVVLFGSGAGWIEYATLANAARNAAEARRDPGHYVVQSTSTWDHIEAFWLVSHGLVTLAVLFALVVATAALSVHRAEWLMSNRRSLATLNADGVSVKALHRVAMRQTLLAIVPVSVIGAVIGTLVMSPAMTFNSGGPIWIFFWPIGRAILMALFAIGAAMLVTRLARRRLELAAAPTNLRTE